MRFIPSSIKDDFKKILCESRFDPVTQKIYSVDASIFEVTPYGVVLPKNSQNLFDFVNLAKKHQIALTPRGSGSGIAGGCLGEGMIIDTSKCLNKILKIDLEHQYVICEPGVIQDHLNAALAPYGFRLGPDTSTGDRATLGGMVANNAAGARSLYFGSMQEAIEEVSLILIDGVEIIFKELNEKEWNQKLILPTLEGKIYRKLDNIRKNKSSIIEKHFPPLPRRSSGYNLRELIKPFPINPAKLIAGSEGTLGLISELKIKIVPKLPSLELHLFPFNSMLEAMKAVSPLLDTYPISLEMIDDKILRAGKFAPSLKGKLDWLKEIPRVLLIAEYIVSKKSDSPMILNSNSDMESLWEMRKNGLGLLLSKRSYSRAIAFIEDVSIPPSALPEFMDVFLKYLKSKDKEAGIYGHVGPGCLHIRPYMDIRNPKEVEQLKTIMEDVALLLKKVGGALSGEHGDGLIRTWLNESFFEEEIYQIFREIKQVFDPLNLMNPHKIVNPIPIEKHLRKGPKQEPKTFLNFDGGLALSADLCNGNGACRKPQDIMCPSFQVTKDEYDTTRARANIFRKLMQGTEKADLGDTELHQILDLCIQCKGCKVECPSQVDMAKMKSEALYHYQEKNGYSLRSAIFAYIDKINPISFPFRSFLNFIMPSILGKKFLSLLGIGLTPPLFSKARFSHTAAQIYQPEGKEIILLSDTYTEFYCPEVGIAAIKILNNLNFKVIVPPWKCCGRPAISKGFLKHAKKNAKELSEQIKNYPNVPIISLEPSCFSIFADEYADLLKSQWDFSHFYFFDSFLQKHFTPLSLNQNKKIAIHGHCHQKAFGGMKETLSILNRISGLEVIMIPSGCCGMAGSFGYEEEHVEFSKQIADLKLIPFINTLDPAIDIIACGYSCRTQIYSQTGKKAFHLAEWINQQKFKPFTDLVL